MVVRKLVGATSSTDSEKGNITVTTATVPDDSVPADPSKAVAEITVVRDANHTLGATIPTDSEKGNITVTTATVPDDSVPADPSKAVAEITVVRDANHTLGATIRSLGRC
ncbi:MAG: hypothetical protein DMG76_19705 [Acidobacteria bacterium]|nr:MAG: hypothetical protein DMG76_19705 [Acidobacteriota bacterium]